MMKMNMKADLDYLESKTRKLKKCLSSEIFLKERVTLDPELLPALEALQREMGHIEDDIARVKIQIRNNS